MTLHEYIGAGYGGFVAVAAHTQHPAVRKSYAQVGIDVELTKVHARDLSTLVEIQRNACGSAVAVGL